MNEETIKRVINHVATPIKPSVETILKAVAATETEIYDALSEAYAQLDARLAAVEEKLGLSVEAGEPASKKSKKIAG